METEMTLFRAQRHHITPARPLGLDRRYLIDCLQFNVIVTQAGRGGDATDPPPDRVTCTSRRTARRY